MGWMAGKQNQLVKGKMINGNINKNNNNNNILKSPTFILIIANKI